MENKIPLWTKNFILISLTNLFIYCGFQMFPSAMPTYVKNIGGSDQILGLLTGITTAATLLIRPLTGMLLDRFGRKYILLLGIVIMFLATISYRFFPIVSIIMVIRFLHGIGWGLSNTASNTIASDLIPQSRFGEGMGYFSLSTSLALAVAPALSLSMGMDQVFLLATVFVLISLFVSFFITYQKEENKQTNTKNNRMFEVHSLVPSIIIFLCTTTYGAIITFLAIYAREKGIENGGLFFTGYAVSLLVTRPFLGRIFDKYGLNVGVYPGLILLFLSVLILPVINSAWLLVLSSVLFGIGMGILQTCLQTMAILKAPPTRKGAANATFFTGFDGGIGFGSILSGLIASYIGYGPMFAVLSICPVIALLFFLFSLKKEKQKKLN